MENKPYKTLEIADTDQWPSGYDPYGDAVENFSSIDLKALVRLLRSEEHFISRRGLHLFGQLGGRAYPIVDEALKLADHPEMTARNALIDGILCYTNKLEPIQVQQILAMADALAVEDSLAAVVQSKLVAFIGALKLDVVVEAIDNLPDKVQRLEHLAAYRSSLTTIANVQHVFDEFRKYPPLQLIYSFASIERAAREGTINAAPIYTGADFVSDSVVMNVKRIIDQNLRQKNPDEWRKQILIKRRARADMSLEPK